LAVRDLSLHPRDRYTRRCCDRMARVTRSQCLVPSAYACLWPKADISTVAMNVRFRGKADLKPLHDHVVSRAGGLHSAALYARRDSLQFPVTRPYAERGPRYSDVRHWFLGGYP
jgi:hypothetical protein